MVAIIIGEDVFKSKKEATEKVKSILHAYNSNERLNHEDKVFIEQLIFNHPHAEQKIGSGIEAISVRTNPVYKQTRNFIIERLDGSETDFSYVKCITPPTPKANFAQACRKSVEPYIKAYRKAFFDECNGISTCPITGETIRLEHSHVDHIPPRTFENLLLRFIQEEQIVLEQVSYIPLADNQYGRQFDGEVLENKWIAYHNENASLRVVSPIANLSHIQIEANKLKKELQ